MYKVVTRGLHFNLKQANGFKAFSLIVVTLILTCILKPRGKQNAARSFAVSGKLYFRFSLMFKLKNSFFNKKII